MTVDIAEFLIAQLDEDESTARAASSGEHWLIGRLTDHGHLIASDIADEVALASPNARHHIARWDPARVLAEVAAKRALLRLWQEMDGSDSYEASAWAQTLVDQLLAPYGKRAVFTRTGSSGPLSWQLENLPGELASDGV